MKKSIIINHSCFGLICFLLIACGHKKTEVVNNTIRPVKYGEVALQEDILSETFSGSAQTSKETKMSFKVGGTITNLAIKVGDIVKSGQLIARIDQTDYSIQHQQSLANLKSAETQIQSSKTQLVTNQATYKRVEKLYENNSVSISDFEQAKSAYELAESAYNASVAQAKASQKQVEAAQNQVRYSTLVAPFAGVITAISIEENEQVGSGTPIATVSALDNPEISVGIPEIIISKIKKNQSVEVSFSSIPNESFSGKVYEVGYSSLGGSTYPVTVRIDQPNENIRPGMAANVQFNFKNGDSSSKRLVVPVASVGEDGKGHFVFSLVKEETYFIAKKKNIQIGELTPDGFEIKAGLEPGELVATAGLNALLDGIQVRLMDEQ